MMTVVMMRMMLLSALQTQSPEAEGVYNVQAEAALAETANQAQGRNSQPSAGQGKAETANPSAGPKQPTKRQLQQRTLAPEGAA